MSGKLLLLLSAFLIIAFVVYKYPYPLSENQRASNPKNGSVTDVKNELLNKLSTEVQVSYFNKLMGDSTFLNFSPDRKQKEYIYVDSDYYVQAITNSDDKVLAYSITTRKKEFKPTFNKGLVKFKLGETTFSEIEKNPSNNEKCYGFTSGATASSYYFEEYYRGNPGNYLTYLYGVNDSGYNNQLDKPNGLFFVGSPENFQNNGGIYECNKIPGNHSKYRAAQAINTYMEIAPSMIFENIYFKYGVSYHQVRLLY